MPDPGSGMSDIYPAEDLIIANNNMGAGLREVILALPLSDAHNGRVYGFLRHAG